MGNPHRGQVSIELGGKPFDLQFDNHVVAVLEEKLGFGYAYLLMNFNKLVGVGLIARMIWAALQYRGAPPEYRKYSVERIVTLIDPTEFPRLVEAVAGGLAGWQGLVDEEPAADKKTGGTKDSDPLD